MDKFKNFCKKPLIIISSSMIGVFLIAILLMLCIPKGKTYTYKYEVDMVQYTYKVELGDKFVATHTYTNERGDIFNVESSKPQEYEYIVDNKELFLVDKVTGEKVKIGKISSTKLVLDYNVEEEAENTKLYCNVNRALLYVFIIGLYFGIFLLSICIAVNYVYKKQELLKEKAENIAEVQREIKEANNQEKKEA